MQLPPALTNLASNTVAQVVAFAGLAVLASQLAATSPSTIDTDLASPQAASIRSTFASQAMTTASLVENSTGDLQPSDSTPDTTNSQAAQYLIPAGLAAASGPISPTRATESEAQTTPRISPTTSRGEAPSRHTFNAPPVRKVKPWFTDGPQDPEGAVQLSPRDQAAWEADSALMHTDHPYYDGRFTTAELAEINRIRGLDRAGKLNHVESLDRVQNWVEGLNRTGKITPEQGDAYEIRLHHANNLYDEATYDGNLEPSKPVSILRRAASTVVDFIPVVGNLKSAYEAIVGVDPITGEELSALDRAAAAGTVLLPGLKVAKKGMSIVKGVLKYGDEAVDAERFAIGLMKARKSATSTAKAVAPAKRQIGKTVLGRFPEYVELSDKLGARRFDIPKGVWDKMSDAEKWTANKKFLDRTISRGDAIHLASTVDKATPGTFFRKELEYLMENGYKINADGKTLVPPGP